MSNKKYLIYDECEGTEVWYDEGGLYELGESTKMIAEDDFKFKDINHVIEYLSDFNYKLEGVK